MKILILGSEGQIGKPLSKHLIAQGHKVRGFDLNGEKREDLRHRAALDFVLKRYDFCFFLAFDVGGSTYLAKHQKTKEFLDNNVKIMLHTFMALERFQIPFIFASSQMSNMSHSPYGTLKALGEHYTRALGGLMVKFWNVYGMERDQSKTHVITDFIRMALRDKVVRLRTTGAEERQFLHVEDCCKGLAAVLYNYGTIQRDMPLHITSFQWTPIWQVAELVSNLCNCRYERGKDEDKIQNGQVNQPDKAIIPLWSPQISLEEGVSRVWDEMLTEELKRISVAE